MREKLKHLEQAQKYLLKGNVEKAISEYQRAVELDPNDNTTRLRLAELLGKAGRKNEAIEEFLKVADVYSKRGFYMQAIAAYKHILRIDPLRVDINEKIGDLYRKQGLIGEAVAQYLGVLRHLEKEKRVSDAVELIKKISETDPSNYTMRARLVMICWKEGLKEQGDEELERIHKELLEKGLLPEAQEIYTKIIEEFPDNIDLMQKLCDVYFRMSDREKLIGILRNIEKICEEKRQPELLKRLGRKYGIRLEELTKSEVKRETITAPIEEEILEGEIISTEPEKEPAQEEFDLREKFVSITEKNKYSFESIFEEFKKGISEQLSKEDYDSHYNLGIAYKEMGLYDDAIGEFQISMNDSEKRVSSILMISSCLVEKGEGQRACELIKDTIDQGGLERQELIGLKYQLALAYKACGRYKEALTEMEEVYSMDNSFLDVERELSQLKQLAEQEGRA
ncbi:MAG: tetratricopeptide repeat protein [Candidatus Aenigmatarchaeota archaeon]